MLSNPTQPPSALATMMASQMPSAATQTWGTLSHIGAQSVHIQGLSGLCGLGDIIAVDRLSGDRLEGEVISLDGPTCVAMMYGRTKGLKIGQKAYRMSDPAPAPSHDWIGRVLSYDGRTATGYRPEKGGVTARLDNSPPQAILRKPLGPRMKTGVSCLDTFLPICRGQRVGLFAGSGVGKSTLLATLAKGSDADVNIIALIGERGREVRTFVEETMGEEGMKNTILFVATSDEPSAIRLRTAHLAIATAETFRDQGQHVLFMCDSLSRYADAHRDVALTAGEVPSLRAYPPSTFGALSAFCERAGPGLDESGDISAVFSVLVAGSNMEEPVADMVRGILDGHIILERGIAERGRYPAISLPRSISRSLPEAASDDENTLLARARDYVLRFEEAKTLIQAGLYVAGSDSTLDIAIKAYPALDAFMGQINGLSIAEQFSNLKMILEHAEGVQPEPDLAPKPDAVAGRSAAPST